MSAIYFTGHEIADRVAQSFHKLGYIPYDLRNTKHPCERQNTHIAYGILRGTSEIFKTAKLRKERFIFVDKGFLKSGHYDGYYRLGVNSFQQPYEVHAFGLERLENILGGEKIFSPIKKGDYILVCPPTEAVANFYNLGSTRIWLQNTLADIVDHTDRPIKVRFKSDANPLLDDLSKSYCVVTHSSSVAWQAARHGIPAITDKACIMHNWNELKLSDIESNLKMQVLESDVVKLLSFMSAYQFTLKEIESGAAKHILEGR